MVGGIRAAFPIDIDTGIGFKPEIFYVQMRIDLHCILRRGLWDHFGNFRKARIAAHHQPIRWMPAITLIRQVRAFFLLAPSVGFRNKFLFKSALFSISKRHSGVEKSGSVFLTLNELISYPHRLIATAYCLFAGKIWFSFFHKCLPALFIIIGCKTCGNHLFTAG